MICCPKVAGAWKHIGVVPSEQKLFEFGHKPNTENSFDCLWSDIKQELWLNSIISGKHWHLDWSAEEKNNPVLFWRKKMWGIHCQNLQLQSVKKNFWFSLWFFGSMAFEIRATLHGCCNTNNYNFTIMFHPKIKYFMHELAIDILWF